ncbi:MAG: sodium:solute symporter family protein [Bacteroidota bacterium]
MPVSASALDILIFIAFFVVNVVVGFRVRGKSQTFREYAVGNKKFSTATLTATIVATWVSGSVFFYSIEQTYSKGLYYILALPGIPAGQLIIAYLVGPRMGKFMHNISVPEVLGELYGKTVQFIIALSSVLYSVGFISIQFKVISQVLVILFGYKGLEVPIISATLVILYSTFGGVKAVTFTDVVQFFTFGSFLPVFALVIWGYLPAPGEQVGYLLNTSPFFSLREVIDWTPEFMGTVALLCYFMTTPSLPPQLFQRMVMARDTTQLKQAFTYAAVLIALMLVIIVWVSILLLADHPGLAPNQVVDYMVNKYTYPGLKGLLGVGVIALAMSTADSLLNSCAVLMANDMLPMVASKPQNALKIAKRSTFVLGFSALLMDLQVQNLLQLLLLTANFYIPIVAVPIALTIFGFQTSKRVVFMAIATGFVVTATCLFYFKSVNSFFPGMLANLGVMLGAHYGLGERGGWGYNPRKKPIEFA